MTRFNSQQIDQFLSAHATQEAAPLSEDFLKANEEKIMQRIHSHNVHHRAGWMAAAASLLLLIVAGVTIHLLPSHFSHNPADTTLHALYDVNDATTDEELNEQETLIECDTYLEFV